MYVSKNGSRSATCGSPEDPCLRIDDVLFNREGQVIIYLDPGPEKMNRTTINNSTPINKKSNKDGRTSTRSFVEMGGYEYEIYLPLNLKAAVSFRSWHPNKTIRPVITTKHDRMFIIENNQSFFAQDINFKLMSTSRSAILLEIDSIGFHLENATLKNVEIKSDSECKVIYMKTFQSITNIQVDNVKIYGGSLVAIVGNPKIDSSVNKKSKTIENLHVTGLMDAKHVVYFESTPSRCRVGKVEILNSTKIDYALFFIQSVCKIDFVLIRDAESIKHTAIHVTRKRNQKNKEKPNETDKVNGKFSRDFQEIGRYLSTLPFSKPEDKVSDKGKGLFSIEKVHIENCTMTTAIEVSNNKRDFKINHLVIKNNTMENTIELTGAHFESNDVFIFNNSIGRNIYQQKQGNLKIHQLLIKNNTVKDISKAIVYQAGEKTTFEFTNAHIEWREIKESHPPLADIYLGKSFY